MSIPSETLSEKAVTRQAYIHEHVEACTITQVSDHDRSVSINGLSHQKDPDGYEAIDYPAHKLEEHINMRAVEGWKLAFMEPHWQHESRHNFARPFAVVGWYLTFKRRKRRRRL